MAPRLNLMQEREKDPAFRKRWDLRVLHVGEGFEPHVAYYAQGNKQLTPVLMADGTLLPRGKPPRCGTCGREMPHLHDGLLDTAWSGGLN